MNLFSLLKKEEKEEKPKCAWCGTEKENLPFTKIKGGKEFRFCSDECRRNFRVHYNQRAKTRTCSPCLLKKIRH
ncbi:MAG: hypothetical protein ABIE23_03510 [archaeon]|nr:hypothetical protein [Candidatus Micrarchaeota archaeon]